VTMAGKSRIVSSIPGYDVIWDIAADGRLLRSHVSISAGQMVVSPSNGPERNVSALTWANVGALSAFTDSGISPDYTVFFRRLDGSAAVEIGEGQGIGCIPDAKYAIAFLPSQPSKLRIRLGPGK